MRSSILRKLPSIDELMRTPELAALVEEHDRELVVDTARDVVESVRREVTVAADPGPLEESVTIETLAHRIADRLRRELSPSLRGAINATGIILHTGLGRAMLPESALEQIADVARGYCNLAIEHGTGQRGSRDTHISNLLCRLTGAEAATVVNNNAAATMLILNTLAQGREVIVSRGQLVEIGGSFRMPEVMASSGAIMREVGTTNKTHLRDYAQAINENTGAILKVHQSNYRIVGFTEEPSIGELAELAARCGLPVIDDLGSGALVDLSTYGIEREPMVQDSVRAGADAVCFSGDKLIGGPQSGIIVGKADVIARVKKNQLARTMRIGKLDVAGLEATLRLFLDTSRLDQQHPTYRMLSLKAESIGAREEAVAEALEDVAARIAVVDGSSQVGSGSSAGEMLSSKHLSVRPDSVSAESLARRLRHWSPSIFPRIQQENVLLDFRTVRPEEDEVVIDALRRLLSEERS